MSDVVERLDAVAAFLAAHHCDAKAIDDAKDEITRLRAQVASLTAAAEGERERCAPEPVVKPLMSWPDEYAEWYNQENK